MSIEQVLIDTCIWIGYFNRPRSKSHAALDVLLDDNRAALLGLVVAEVLQGCRNRAEADWVASELRGVPFIDPTWKEWRLTAEICRNLARLGKAVPMTDIFLAAVAQNRGLSICTIDPHFDLFENLQRVDLQKPDHL